MNYMEAIEAIERMVSDARGVPLSASAVIPREEALNLIREIKAALPQEHRQAVGIVGQREQILTDAHEKSAFIIEQAREERSRLLSKAEVVHAAEREAKRIVDEAQAKAGTLANQADDYADAKLANMEILLSKVLRTIGKGREQLRRRLDAAMAEVAPLELDDSGEISGPLPTINPE